VSIGDKVRATRKAAGISQEEVARRAGVSLNVINRLERGVILDPHYSTLRGIASALGVPVEDLLREPALAGKAEASDTGQRSSEVADYPYPWMGDALARTIDHWTEVVGWRFDPKYSHHIAVCCMDLLRHVLRLDAPGDTLAERVPEEAEFDQRVRVAEKLFGLVQRAQDHYVDSEEAEAAEVQSFEQRREAMKRRTKELSA
jgi:transcriptional regulator with XRE-family HTH domain